MPQPPKADSSAPSPAELSWLEHARADQQKAPERLEETAKYLSGVVSIALTIFISKQSDEVYAALEWQFIVAVLLWMFAVVLSAFVLFPWPYRFESDSPERIQAAYRRVVRNKLRVLIASMACFLTGLGLAVWAFLGVG